MNIEGYYTTIEYNEKENKINYIVIIVLVILALIVSYFLLFKNLFKNRYTKMEEKMISSAKKYVINNNVSTDKEIYFDVSKLDIKLDDDCLLTSGVIYDGSAYTANLMCSYYNSKIIQSNEQGSDYITLKGDEVIALAKGIKYIEPGYDSKDIVNISGWVGSEEGVYNLYYKTINSNSFVQRKVIIIDNDEVKSLFPTINLIGNEIIYVKEGDDYKDPGVIGSDTVDGFSRDKVETDGIVDANTVGDYVITYSVTNSRGYKNSVRRKVIVVPQESDLYVDYTISPETLTSENVIIKINTSTDFYKIVYPDGRTGTDLEYTVKENGKYVFTIIDTYDRMITKEVEINNIDKNVPEGSCIATSFYDRTEIKVEINSEREISSYSYYINGTALAENQSKTYISSIRSPSLVKVIVKDSINNQTELTCSIEKTAVRKIVTDAKGKNCLEGMACYIQFNYGDSTRYPFCSVESTPSACGGIGRNGCSITSVANALAAMGMRSSTGVLHTPYTVWDELYPINKSTGHCGGGCSGWTRMRDAIVNSGLTAPRKVSTLSNNTMSTVLSHLRKGYPVIVRAVGKPFSSGTAHYLTLIGINDEGKVFLSDSANRSGIEKYVYEGKQYYVDTWISPEDLITGNVKEFLLVGPAGMFEGK